MGKDQNPSKINIKNIEEEGAGEEKHPVEACVDGEAEEQYCETHGRRPGREEGRSAMLMLHQIRESLNISHCL